MAIAVVTDSTASMPAALATKHEITVVPLHVVIDGESFTEGVEVTAADVAAALRARRAVSTSRPTPAAMLAAYEAAASRGATAVVSVHLSGLLSGTLEAAQVAARDAPLPVHVVDTRLIGMGVGFAALSAATAAAAGATAEEARDAASARAAGTIALFYVDTLEYLRRSGRVPAAAAVLGTVLSVKPLMQMDGGQIKPLERVRTSARALGRLQEMLVAALADGAAAEVAVHHLDADDRAEALAATARAQAGVRDVVVSPISAVVGAHTGPGMVALAVAPL